MTAIVWFSCPRHYPSLAISIAAAKALDPSARVVVCLDPADPAPSIDGIELLRLGFDRGEHLNGLAAVRGVAAALAEAGKDADRVAKIDSDMAPRSPFWLTDGMLGFRRGASWWGVYSLPAAVARILPAALDACPSVCQHEANVIGRYGSLLAFALGAPVRTPSSVTLPSVVSPIRPEDIERGDLDRGLPSAAGPRGFGATSAAPSPAIGRHLTSEEA